MKSGEGCVKAKLSKCALGVTVGVLKALCLMIMAWMSFYFGYGTAMVDHVAAYYPGYASSFVGGIIGGVYGLVGGFIFGFIFAYIYNFCLCYCVKRHGN